MYHEPGVKNLNDVS